MQTDRIARVRAATPEQLAEIDNILEGRAARRLRLWGMTAAARALGISRVTLYRAIRDGKIRTVEIRPGTRRIPEVELRRFAGVAR